MNIVYKFRAILEDNESFTVDLDLYPDTTFEEFHQLLVQAIKFDGKHEALFFKSDDAWRRVEEIEFENFGKEEVSDYIDTPRQKFLYYYDPENSDWCFNIEIIKMAKIEEEDLKAAIVKTTSVPPKQYVAGIKSDAEMEEEEDSPRRKDKLDDIDDSDFYKTDEVELDTDDEDIEANTDDIELDDDIAEDTDSDFSADIDDDRY